MEYFNNAATSWPKAPGCAEAVAEVLQAVPSPSGRASHGSDASGSDCRSLLSGDLKVADSSRIVLCPNATHAINTALHGFPWGPTPVAITTSSAHNAVLRPLYLLEKSRNLHLEVVPVEPSGRISLQKFKNAVKELTPQLVVLCHASNVTGAINPVPELVEIARRYGAKVLVDASQTMGLADVAPELWGADLAAFTGHKYLLGPPGTGALFVSKSVDLLPVWVGGTGNQSDLKEMPEALPSRLEAGTPNDPAFAGLAQALRWQNENPLDAGALDRKTEDLSRGLVEAGALVNTVEGPRTPIVSFSLPGFDPEEVGELLFQGFGIVCRTGLHCAPLIHSFLKTGDAGNVRLSLSRFTTDDQIAYVCAAVRSLLE